MQKSGGYNSGSTTRTAVPVSAETGTGGKHAEDGVELMQPPQQNVPNCPPGLEYLTHVDQILVYQKRQLSEGKWRTVGF